MEQRKVINSPGRGLKKAEAKKRQSPFTPYREKAKKKRRVKKLNQVLVAQVYRARVRVASDLGVSSLRRSRMR
jgi:hypothetical protein